MYVFSPKSYNTFSKNNKLLKEPREIEVIAYIRFSSDSVTLKSCLESLNPAITKGILAYHKKPKNLEGVNPACYLFQDDGSLQIALEFCKNNPGFKVAYYPEPVYPFQDHAYRRGERDFKNTLGAFYEFTRLQCLKIATTDDPYIYKVDCDHIYCPEIIQKEIEFLANRKEKLDFLPLCKYNVHYCAFRDELYFISLHDLNDHFALRAKNYCFINRTFENGETYDFNAQIKEMNFIERIIFKDFYDNYQKLLAAPIYATEEEYQNALASGASPLPEILEPPKYWRYKSFKYKSYRQAGVSSLHFFFIHRVLDNARNGYKGFIVEDYEKGYNLKPYKEFRESEEFKELAEAYPDLKDPFFSYESIIEKARQFNFSMIQEYLDYYREHPGEDYPQSDSK